MVRVKRGKITRRKHKKILKATKGYKGARSRRVKVASEALMKALSYAYRDRRRKKRERRRLWILRLNAASREYGIPYNKFIKDLSEAKIDLDRKILADLAINEPEVFKKIVEKVKKFHAHLRI